MVVKSQEQKSSRNKKDLKQKKMNNLTLKVFTIALVVFSNSVYSQDFQWAKHIGGTGDDQGASIALDIDGNVYTTGYFNGTVDFDPGPETFELTSVSSNSDIFISKLDVDGNFVWAKTFGSNGIDQGFSITTDDAGNVYITGAYRFTTDFDPGAGVFNLSTTLNGVNIFILKLLN